MTCGAGRPGLWPPGHPPPCSPRLDPRESSTPSSSKSHRFNRQIAYSSIQIHYSLDLDPFCKPNPHINTYPCLLQPHPIQASSPLLREILLLSISKLQWPKKRSLSTDLTSSRSSRRKKLWPSSLC
jgi:hypothetical protein